jgi:lysophospholipase L1-like esterase
MNRRTFLLGSLALSGCSSGGQSVKPLTRIACVGDSITAGVGGGVVTPYPGLLQMAHPEWEVRNYGHSGDRVADVAKRLPEILDWKPDVVTLMIGTNDERDGLKVDAFHTRLYILVREFGNSSHVVLASPPPNLIRTEQAQIEFTDAVSDCVLQLHSMPCPVYSDLFPLIPSIFTPPETVHPNQHGHEIMARCFETAILGVLK